MPKNAPQMIVPYEIAVGQYLPGHDWRCERLLGRGGMGSVYQMVRGELAWQGAVKLLHRNLAWVRLHGDEGVVL